MFKRIIQKIKTHCEFFKNTNQEGGWLGIVLGVIAGIGGIYGYFAGIEALSEFAATIVNVINGFTFGLLDLSGRFLQYTLGPEFVSQSLTKDPNFVLVWANVRDLTNMLIVLSFVFIGIATTLRLRDYEAKKLLFPLILVAMLINFSGLICNNIFDTANTVQSAFLRSGGAGGVSSLVSSMDRHIKESGKRAGDEDKQKDDKLVGSSLGAAITSFLIILFGSIVFTMLAVLLTARYAILVLFYILSPLAMFCYVFPITKKWFHQWWEQFLRWSFMGTIAGFLIYLAATSIPSQATEDSTLYFISFVFIYLAYKFARSGAAIGASAVLAGAGAVAGFATGAVGLGALGKLAGLKGADAGSKTRSAISGGIEKSKIGQSINKFGERIGLTPPGTTNLKQQKQLKDKDSEDRIKTLAPEQKLKLATSRAGITTRGRNDKINAIKDLAENGGFTTMSTDQQKAAMKYATSYGVSPKIFTKANPNLATEVPDPNKGPTDRIKDAVRGTSSPDAAKWHPKVITEEVIASASKQQFNAIGRGGAPELADKVRSYIIPNGARPSQLTEEAKSLIKKITDLPFGSSERNAVRKEIAAIQARLKNSEINKPS